MDALPIRKKRSAVIRTLDPSRLAPSDFIDASLKTGLTFKSYNCKEVAWLCTEPIATRFPAGTRGFLYYHLPTDSMPSAAGEIRFRLTPGDNPQSFKLGNDFLQPNGLPWRIPLLVMTKNGQNHAPLRELLLADGLITSALVTKCREMTKANARSVRRDSIIIHSLSQPFPVAFTRGTLSFWVLTRKNVQPIILQHLFLSHSDQASEMTVPYSGGKFSNISIDQCSHR